MNKIGDMVPMEQLDVGDIGIIRDVSAGEYNNHMVIMSDGSSDKYCVDLHDGRGWSVPNNISVEVLSDAQE